MYHHPATQANLDTLRRRGLVIIPPGEGQLASLGEHGVGRLAEPAELLEACESLLRGFGDSWSGLRVLVTAGGTREPIDSVRYIGNRSSGRMGVALAAGAAARGAEVTLVAANLAVSPPAGVTVAAVQTAEEMLAACEREFPAADVLLMAAAVADFRPAAPADHKIKKDRGIPEPIVLEPTRDVLRTLVTRRRPDQVLVGFAAEHGEDAVQYGRAKLEGKGVDLVVVNDISRMDIGFDARYNEVVIVSADGERPVSRGPKEEIAAAILDEVQRRRERQEDGSAREHPRSAARI
jgi:phosphopantothenoylcysteine decarboxylase/phosphopantothenate--cysteine ligase